jgi:diphosphomevalonate decarboxylase
MLTASVPDTQSFAWRCPSNIALVKYWGKWGNQYPRNPSVSFTLSEAYTETRLVAQPLMAGGQQAGKKVALSFQFEGNKNEAFAHKVQYFLDSLVAEFPFLPDYSWHIDSHNSFPHSSGIASSASAMGALALCLCSAERAFCSTLTDEEAFWRKASRIARLGSGSACRSVYAQAAVWGICSLADSSDEYALPFADYLHPEVRNFQDTILIVSRAEKQISSRAGHALMNNNPYADIRYEQAKQNVSSMLAALQTGDMAQIIAIAEAEALALHALMMTSSPSYTLIRPNTLHIIEKIRQLRHDTQLPLCFTLDAGPNVHVLYPEQVASQVMPFIQSELVPYCENAYYIADYAGNGATSLV